MCNCVYIICEFWLKSAANAKTAANHGRRQHSRFPWIRDFCPALLMTLAIHTGANLSRHFRIPYWRTTNVWLCLLKHNVTLRWCCSVLLPVWTRVRAWSVIERFVASVSSLCARCFNNSWFSGKTVRYWHRWQTAIAAAGITRAFRIFAFRQTARKTEVPPGSIFVSVN